MRVASRGDNLPEPGAGFRWVEEGGPVVLKVDSLESTGLVKAGFSSGRGGIDSSPGLRFNLGFDCGDDRGVVESNRRRLLDAVGLDPRSLVAAGQVHECGVGEAGRPGGTGGPGGTGRSSGALVVPGVDALVTDRPGVTIVIGCADCLAVYVLDLTRPAIGLAHAGWRGCAGNMPSVLLGEMERRFGSDPARVLAAISPGIGPCCYEVDEPVRRAFAAGPAGRAGPGVFAPAPGDARGGRHWRLDLAEACRLSLEEAGVAPQNIASSSLCTSCHPSVFFSHRRDLGRTGRMLAFMALTGRGIQEEVLTP
jgi:YfiH family protein